MYKRQLYDHRIPKFEYGPERANIKPVIDPVDCKNLRVYPFRGAKSPEIILRAVSYTHLDVYKRQP